MQHANLVIDWQDNLAREEMPPRWMWPFVDELEIWFEEVEEQRKAKYGSNNSDSTDTDSPMMENELARGRR